MSMFCYQCEQTAKNTGCTSYGVCGKAPEVSSYQDISLHLAKGIAVYLQEFRRNNLPHNDLSYELIDTLFYTITNVNFREDFFISYISKLNDILQNLRNEYNEKLPKNISLPEIINFHVSNKTDEIIRQSWDISIEKRTEKLGADLVGLQELLLYGLKGTASYAHHANIYKLQSVEFASFVEESLAYLALPNPELNHLLTLSLKCGEQNLKIMEILDKAHTDSFGHPEPTKVRTTPIKGKAILVSGHDLHDLETLLQATENKNINIYTHGEMLPALAYPKLKKYKHLIGNYGSAWQNQAKEFDSFPGAILMTTNCIQKPLESYRTRIFTTGLVGFPNVTHVKNGEWQEVINAAISSDGFIENAKEHFITIGFAHNAVINIADKIVSEVKSGNIKKFVLIGGCDGAKTGRDYFTQLAEKLPQDTIILTLACGKYRFNMQDFGTVAGLPRLLDMGQCNDTYSAIKIAIALAQAFNTNVNSLPLSLVLSWYEQKAIAVLLTLLYLDIKNIRVGPTLPAFLTPNLINILVEKFALKPIGNVEEDLKDLIS